MRRSMSCRASGCTNESLLWQTVLVNLQRALVPGAFILDESLRLHKILFQFQSLALESLQRQQLLLVAANAGHRAHKRKGGGKEKGV